MSVLGSLFGGGAKTPTYTPPQTQAVAPTPAITADSTSLASGALTRSAAAAAAGLQSTVKTSAQGAAAAPTATKTLLGQ